MKNERKELIFEWIAVTIILFFSLGFMLMIGLPM